MKVPLLLSFFLILFYSSACQKYTHENLPDKQIHFGEGGGITGAIREYCLLKNGELLDKQHFTENFKPFKKVKRRTAKKQFKKCKKMEMEQIKLDDPGDKYYFIAYETKDSKHRITWGGKNATVSEEVLELYENLKSLTIE